MPAVFVHGNPESAAIWDELFTHLARKDVVALSPPGAEADKVKARIEALRKPT